jgi:O-antigen/teichoic acid export membrane protein
MPAPRSSLWIDRSLRFAMGSSATIASALLGILRNKWIATQLQAAGLGVLAQTSSAQMWLGALGGMGLGLPVGRAVGAAQGTGDEASARRTVWTALSLVGLGTTVVAAVGLVFASPISVALLGTPGYALLFRIASVGAAVLYGFFAGRSDLKANLTLALSGGAAGLLVTVALVPAWGLAGAAIGAATLAPAGILGVILFHRRAYAGALVPAPRPRLDWRLARPLLAVGAAAVTLSLVDLGVMVTVRAH